MKPKCSWVKDSQGNFGMDDANKAAAHFDGWSESDPHALASESQAAQRKPAILKPARIKQTSTDDKALERWFDQQCGKKRIPKRLDMPNERLDIPNELLVTSGGPLKMTGNITLINEDGSVTHANNLNLCRCGGSQNSPFCDERHLDIEFLDTGAMQSISDWIPVNRPQNVTVTCVKNGPLKFRGYLRIYNKKGQECITMGGALCRCGKSSNKPFCDNEQGCC